jgi:secondary thiamine-phosphate synthase enzyme
MQFQVSTAKRNELIDISHQVERAIKDAGATNGIACIFVPHTTAGITINENADPDVGHDALNRLAHLAPQQANYRHAEGNADAHIKSILSGSSVTVFIEEGRLQLGQWQGIFLCEFDGPRRREVWLKIIAD